jgi:hypothetical protein
MSFGITNGPEKHNLGAFKVTTNLCNSRFCSDKETCYSARQRNMQATYRGS